MKILIIRFSSIGDIVLTQPIVKRLHEVFPQAELFYLTKPQYSSIPLQFGVPLKIVTGSELRLHYSGLQRKQFDLVFDLQNKLNSFLVKAFYIRAKSFTYNKQRSLRQRIVKHKSTESISSTLDLYQSALVKASRYMNKPILEGSLDLPVLHPSTDSTDKRINSLFPDASKTYIALFPGANHQTKQYPAESFIDLIRQAGERYHFLLLGSAQEAVLTRLIHSQTSTQSTDLGGRFALPELIDVIDKSFAIISNDSGPMHIAAALGKPQIAIFGATHPRLGFKPLNDKAVILSSDLPCQPCSLHGGKICPLQHFNCMRSILPETLVQNLHQLTLSIPA
jgi:heptosyltransferase-2